MTTPSTLLHVLYLSLLLLIILPSRTTGLFFQNPSSTTSGKSPISSSPPSNVKLLILPGFGNDSIDYTMDNSLVSSLQEKGWKAEQIAVLPVQRTDWLQVFWRGVGDWKFWTAQAPPTRPAFAWYLDRIWEQIESLSDNEKLILIGHSAGGWLGRAALGFGSETEEGPNADMTTSGGVAGRTRFDLSKVVGLVTLGSPNAPPPPGVMDMTRGALRITDERFPGTYHEPELFYLTVMGLSVQGQKQERKSPLEPTTITGFAFNSYEAVCGNGETIGDGVVPQCSGHLEGAKQLDLEGVLHSINAPENWYGSIGVIDRWHNPMLQQLFGSRSFKKTTTATTSWTMSSFPFPLFSSTQQES